MNLAALRQEVYDYLDDEFEESSLRFPQSMMDRFINDGVREMIVRSNCDVDTFTLVPVVGSFEYDLPEASIAVLRVYRDDERREKVWPLTIQDLDLERPGWQETTSNRFEWYFQLGMDKIFLGPAFGSTTDAKYEITYASDPGTTPLTSDTSVIPLDEAHQSAIIDYAAARALFIDGTEEQLGGAATLMGNFQQQWVKLKEETFATLDRTHIMRTQDPGRRDYGVLPMFRRDRGVR